MADRILAAAILAFALTSAGLAQTVSQRPAESATMPPVVFATILPVEFVFDNNVRRTKDLPTSALRAARRAMISGAEISTSDLQALADAGDGLAAFRFAKFLQEVGKPDPDGVAAHYYAIAAYTGRAFAVPPLARLLRNDGAGYKASRLANALNAMTVQALSGNSEAATLLGQMYAEGTPFGRDITKAQALLEMSTAGENTAAALKLGIALMADRADAAAGHPGARAALRHAASGTDLAVRVTAENLLRLLDGVASPQTEVTE